MDRSRLHQYVERGIINRENIVNIRAKLPPLSSVSMAEALAQQLDDLLLIDRTKSHSNVVSIDEFTSCDYFLDLDSYYRLHEQLLKDREYVTSWHSAICLNPHLFKDKVSLLPLLPAMSIDLIHSRRQIVLDVRCGLGVLSMFAAIAGAKHVYAIDKSNIVQLTRRVVRDNRLASKITIVQGSAVDINLPVDKVDIIISTAFV